MLLSFFTNDILFGHGILNGIPHGLDPAMEYFFLTLTTLGNSAFYVFFFPILFWCYNKDFTFRVMGLFFISAFLNSVFKDLCTNPRPCHDSQIPSILPELKELAKQHCETAFGFPSGHTQNAVVFWGSMAWILKKRWMTIAAILLIILIPFSRLYLYVHYPGDVLFGYIIGFSVLLLMLTPLFQSVEQTKTKYFMFIGLFLPFLLMWLAPEIKSLSFLFSKDNLKILSVFSGLALGFYLEEKTLDFQPKGSWKQHLVKLAIGIPGIVVINFGLKYLIESDALFGKEMDISGRLGYFIRNALLGFWIIYLAPLIFTKISFLAYRPVVKE